MVLVILSFSGVKMENWQKSTISSCQSLSYKNIRLTCVSMTFV